MALTISEARQKKVDYEKEQLQLNGNPFTEDIDKKILKTKIKTVYVALDVESLAQRVASNAEAALDAAAQAEREDGPSPKTTALKADAEKAKALAVIAWSAVETSLAAAEEADKATTDQDAEKALSNGMDAWAQAFNANSQAKINPRKSARQLVVEQGVKDKLDEKFQKLDAALQKYEADVNERGKPTTEEAAFIKAGKDNREAMAALMTDPTFKTAIKNKEFQKGFSDTLDACTRVAENPTKITDGDAKLLKAVAEATENSPSSGWAKLGNCLKKVLIGALCLAAIGALIYFSPIIIPALLITIPAWLGIGGAAGAAATAAPFALAAQAGLVTAATAVSGAALAVPGLIGAVPGLIHTGVAAVGGTNAAIAIGSAAADVVGGSGIAYGVHRYKTKADAATTAGVSVSLNESLNKYSAAVDAVKASPKLQDETTNTKGLGNK